VLSAPCSALCAGHSLEPSQPFVPGAFVTAAPLLREKAGTEAAGPPSATDLEATRPTGSQEPTQCSPFDAGARASEVIPESPVERSHLFLHNRQQQQEQQQPLLPPEERPGHGEPLVNLSQQRPWPGAGPAASLKQPGTSAVPASPAAEKEPGLYPEGQQVEQTQQSPTAPGHDCRQQEACLAAAEDARMQDAPTPKYCHGECRCCHAATHGQPKSSCRGLHLPPASSLPICQ
jgi:hypothetical protein